MIHQVKINFKLRLSELLFVRPELIGYENAYKQLISVMTELDVASEKYCLVVKVIKGPFLTEEDKIAKELEELAQKLSKRELQIFRLAMSGLNNKQIAEKLFVSVETVRSHRKRIVSKAGVRKIEEIKDWLLKENFDERS